MTTSSPLLDAWKALEDETHTLPGLYERRVFAHTGFEVFVGLTSPTKSVRLTLIVQSSVPTEGLERETRGFRVHRQYLPQTHGISLSIELINTAFRELFEVVAEDIAARVIASADESAAVEAMRARLNHWERFMRAAGPEGLGREDQIGLFGELLFLKVLLLNSVGGMKAVLAWQGPTGANHDYQFGMNGLEVKTTTGNSPSAARVSNELQLDETDCEWLALLHVWLRSQTGAGQTLPALVDEIIGLLPESARAEFDERLVQAGYHAIHRPLYEAIGYRERHQLYYVVQGDLPRIRRADLQAGVSKVKYRIDLAGFESFQRSGPEVIVQLVGASQ